MNFLILSFLLLFPLIFHNPEKSATGSRSPGTLRFRSQLLTVDANEGIAIADVNGDGMLDVVAGRNWFPAPDFHRDHFVRLPIGTDMWSPMAILHSMSIMMERSTSSRDHSCQAKFSGTKIRASRSCNWDSYGNDIYWSIQKPATTKGVSCTTSTAMETPEWITNSWNPATPVTAWSFESDADGQPTLVRHLIGVQGQAHGMGFGDVNNDGRQDILVGNGWYECPPGDIWSAKWRYHPDWDLGAASLPILVRDLNGDGLNDLVWGRGHDYGLFWSEALGTTSADGKLLFKANLVDESYSQAHAIHFADLDQDGVDELISGKRFRAHNGGDPGGDQMACIYYYRWDSATHTFSKHVIEEGHIGIGLQIRTADLNADGKLDIAVAGKDGTWILFQE